MAEYKFSPSYFEVNYHIKDNTVYRNEDSSGECQVVKEKCLRECFTHFIGIDLTGIKTIKQHFTTNGKTQRHIITRCCCSQFEKDGIMHGIVTHKLTNLSFIVGKDCFSKLFSGADDVKTFWKEECIYCKKIVVKTLTSRPNFCNQKCLRAHEEQEHRKRNAKKVYTKCKMCDKPKKTESQQKWALCYECHNNKDQCEIYSY
jgi:hypothetical protein